VVQCRHEQKQNERTQESKLPRGKRAALEKEETPEEKENRYEPPDPSNWGPQPTKDESLAEKRLDIASNSESGLFLDSEEKIGPEEMAQNTERLGSRSGF
jgi:hypothetical protein